MKTILAVGGSDSGAASGIQADLKAIAAQGAYAVTALTAVTAQTPGAVRESAPLAASLVSAQLAAAFEGFRIAAAKTGMLANRAIVEAVADAFQKQKPPHYVLDPVLASSSGHALLEADGVAVLMERLAPLATLVTPNALEAEALSGQPVRTLDDARAAAQAMLRLGCRAVLVKGGHFEAGKGTDLLVTPADERTFEGEALPQEARGTGCTCAAAIAALLGRGAKLEDAIAAAKRYVASALRRGPAVGAGIGPLDHFHAWRKMP